MRSQKWGELVGRPVGCGLDFHHAVMLVTRASEVISDGDMRRKGGGLRDRFRHAVDSARLRNVDANVASRKRGVVRPPPGISANVLHRRQSWLISRVPAA